MLSRPFVRLGASVGRMDIDLEPVWHTLGGGAAAAAVFTLLRLGLEYGFRHADRRIDRDERHHGQRQDAERRLERCQLEVDAERERRIVIEREYAVLEQLFLDRLQRLPTAQRLTIDA